MNKRFQEILGLAQAGQIQRALAKCEQAIKKNPRDVDFLLLAASLHAQDNDFIRIMEYCKRATRIDPKNLGAQYNLSVAYLQLHDYENALVACKKALKIDKKNAKVLCNLGLAQWKLGQIDEAISSSLSAIQYDPNLATAHNNLGLAYKGQKNTESAIHHFKQATRLDPQLAEAYYNCGITLLDMGDESGNSYLDKALLVKPDYPEANNYKGLQLLENNHATQAIDYFKKAIAHKQDYVEAYCNIGNAFMAVQNFKSAEAMYRKAIEYDPAYASAYNNLGNSLLDQDDFRKHFHEAEQCYLKAIELAPDIVDTYKNLGVCYQGEGHTDKALHYFNLYNEKVPGDEVVIAGMASVYERQGDYEKGIALLRPYIDNPEAVPETTLSYAKLSRHFSKEKDAVDKLLSIDDSNINTKHRIEKYYSLGKLSEKTGTHDETFSYYKKANDLEEEKHDFSQTAKIFRHILDYFSSDKLKSLARSNNNSKLPIFIVGMPRSGTSLAEQILASHPLVYGAGELDNIHHIVQQIARDLKPTNSYPDNLDSMTTTYASELASAHIETLQAMSPDSIRIVDKMPHNFQGLGVINLLFPSATVIHCKRSSIDTCLSIYFQHFNKHHSYSNSLEMLGRYYNLYADMMEHWKNVLDINIIDLEYEQVIADPENEMRNLLEKCSIEWDPACLKFYETKRTVMTPSYDQVRRPIYTSSVARWKKYKHHLGDLLDSLGDRAY